MTKINWKSKEFSQSYLVRVQTEDKKMKFRERKNVILIGNDEFGNAYAKKEQVAYDLIKENDLLEVYNIYTGMINTPVINVCSLIGSYCSEETIPFSRYEDYPDDFCVQTVKPKITKIIHYKKILYNDKSQQFCVSSFREKLNDTR